MSDDTSSAATRPPKRPPPILRTHPAVRERCGQLLAWARRGESRWFAVDDRLPRRGRRRVADATRERYPELQIPYHSRWRHFEAGGVDRRAELERRLGDVPGAARAAALVDLTFVSVLLDAGAGPDWRYVEPAPARPSPAPRAWAWPASTPSPAACSPATPERPLQVDAEGLRALVTDRLARAFQVGPANPLVGLEGRAVLLRRLGEALRSSRRSSATSSRGPAGLFDMIISPLGPDVPPTADVTAHDILSRSSSLSGIWPAGNAIEGVPLGDCWPHQRSGARA